MTIRVSGVKSGFNVSRERQGSCPAGGAHHLMVIPISLAREIHAPVLAPWHRFETIISHSELSEGCSAWPEVSRRKVVDWPNVVIFGEFLVSQISCWL